MLFLFLMMTLIYYRTSVEHSRLDIWQILGKSLVLLLDLESELSGVAQDYAVHLSRHGVQLVEGGEDKHSGFAHTRLSLADNVHS